MKLESFLEKKSPLLLLGRKGMPLLADALELSKVLLNTDNLSVHPDYLFVSTDKKVMGVEIANAIVAKASKRPVIARKSVCVIDEMDKMSVQAQNKLLLTLESNPNMQIIAVCYKDCLLDTVKSRMQKVYYQPLLQKDFVESCVADGMNQEDALLFFYVSDGSLAYKDVFEQNVDMFRDLKNCIVTDKRAGILEILGLLKEKDKESVANNTELMKCVLRVIARICADKAMELCLTDKEGAYRYLVVSRRADEDAYSADSTSYTKNDFFKIIVDVIELGR